MVGGSFALWALLRARTLYFSQHPQSTMSSALYRKDFLVFSGFMIPDILWSMIKKTSAHSGAL